MSLIRIIKWLLVLLVLTVTVYYFYPEKALPPNITINALVVYKSKHQLLAYSNGKLVKTYTISLGKSPVGDKQVEGDNRTPEGVYFINDKNAHSGWHKNLGISYPDANDIAEATKAGKSAGEDIKIHGLKNGQGYIGKFQRWRDWTNGCMALTDEEIDELFNAVPVGTKIEIKP